MCVLAKSSIHSFIHPSYQQPIWDVVRHCQRCVDIVLLPNQKARAKKNVSIYYIFIKVSCLLHIVKLCKMDNGEGEGEGAEECEQKRTFISLRHCSTFHLFELEHYERKLKFNTLDSGFSFHSLLVRKHSAGHLKHENFCQSISFHDCGQIRFFFLLVRRTFYTGPSS